MSAVACDGTQDAFEGAGCAGREWVGVFREEEAEIEGVGGGFVDCDRKFARAFDVGHCSFSAVLAA